MNKQKPKIRENRGITLVALVVTIIVLLILATVSIATLTGENGLITKTQEAKNATEKAGIIEEIQTEILGKQAGSTTGSITEKELTEILENKGTLSDEENIFDKTLTTKKGNYKIKVSDIYNGSLNGTYEAYSLGDEVTIKGTKENFYVLKDSDETEETVTLLARYKIDGEDMVQTGADYSGMRPFALSAYWKNETIPTSSPYFNLNKYAAAKNDPDCAVYIANNYATSENIGAISGRLMTYEEASDLETKRSSDTTGQIAKMLYGQIDCLSSLVPPGAEPESYDEAFCGYWLASVAEVKGDSVDVETSADVDDETGLPMPVNPSPSPEPEETDDSDCYMWCVNWYDEGSICRTSYDVPGWYVRPVIEISKSLIQAGWAEEENTEEPVLPEPETPETPEKPETPKEVSPEE